jgi:deoxyribodipyrimidine photolyase
MPEDIQQACGCVIGEDYPEPIVDHAEARRAAFERYGGQTSRHPGAG